MYWMCVCVSNSTINIHFWFYVYQFTFDFVLKLFNSIYFLFDDIERIEEDIENINVLKVLKVISLRTKIYKKKRNIKWYEGRENVQIDSEMFIDSSWFELNYNIKSVRINWSAQSHHSVNDKKKHASIEKYSR